MAYRCARPRVFALVTATLLCAAGCVAAPAVVSPRPVSLQFVGLVGTVDANGCRDLLVRYDHYGSSELLRVPLARDGRPVASVTTPSAADPFTAAARRSAAAAWPAFAQAAEWPESLVRAQGDPRAPTRLSDGVVAAAYLPLPDSGVRRVPLLGPASGSTLPPGTLVLLLPYERFATESAQPAADPRSPAEDAIDGVGRAVANVGIVIVMTPVFLVLVLVYHKLILI